MRKRNKNILFSVLAVSILSGSLLVATTDGRFVAANNAVWSALETPIKTEYAFGTAFIVPSRTVTINGTQVPAKAVLEYPNGDTTLDTQVNLNRNGTYTLRYTATVNGKAYAEAYTFSVVSAQASVTSDKSSFAYGAYTYDVDRTALIDTETGETERKRYSYTCENGLMVRLARGDTLTFNEVIDIENVTSADSLVKAFATPSEQGTPDFEKLTFTFTDVYNPEIYLTFVSQHTAEGYEWRKTYSRASGNGQKDSGLDFMDASKMYVGSWGTSGDGSYTRRFKTIYQNATTGAWVDEYKEQDEMPIDFRYDWHSKTAYIRDYRAVARINTIADLDSPEHFDTLWSGFTSGKVRLSVSADTYTAETANFCITEVFGLDLQKTEYKDTQAPVITINNEYAEMPTAVVGGKYPVPTATAFDLDVGKCRVKTSVWYNYTSDNKRSVEIKDGWFETKKYGDYAIVYEAVDGNANKAKEVLWVRAEKDVANVELTFEENPVLNGYCGDWVSPVKYKVSNAIGNEADVTVRVQAIIDGQAFDASEGFRPEKAGKYQIVYTAVDYIGRVAEQSYELTVKADEKVKFIDSPQLPKAFISGTTYTMPTLCANDYSTGSLVRKQAYAEITDKNGTKRVECGETFVPTVKAQGDSVTVVYKCGNAQSQTYTIPVTVPMGKNEQGRTRLFASNYLHGTGFTALSTTENTQITATAKDGGWFFANAFPAQDFTLKIRGIEQQSDYNGLWITLSDAWNDGETLQVYAQNLSDGIMFYLGAETIKINNVLNVGGGFTFGYDDGRISVGTTKLSVKTYASGESFQGFSSGKMLVSVRFDGAGAQAKYALEEICGQSMTLQSRDSFAPNITVLGNYGGLKSYNTVVELPVAEAFDVLDPNVTFTLSVKNPDGTVAKDTSGKALDGVDPKTPYFVKMAKYGQYMVVYTAKDSAENTNVWSYPLIVSDEVAPTVTFNTAFAKTAQVGDTLVLPNFTVKDNVTAAADLEVSKFVYTPSGKSYRLAKNSNSIVCAQAGVYEFRVLVKDAAGNLAIYKGFITVTEKTNGGKK